MHRSFTKIAVSAAKFMKTYPQKSMLSNVSLQHHAEWKTWTIKVENHVLYDRLSIISSETDSQNSSEGLLPAEERQNPRYIGYHK